MILQLDPGQNSLGPEKLWRSHEERSGTHAVPRAYPSPIILPSDYSTSPMDESIDIGRPPAKPDGPDVLAGSCHEAESRGVGHSLYPGNRGWNKRSSPGHDSLNITGASKYSLSPYGSADLAPGIGATPAQTGVEIIQGPPTTAGLGPQARKRRRERHDVDGPGTGFLPCKKRRLRLQLITSRLSQPFSLPATHILNRESEEDTPVISRFVKRAALASKKAGHQTTLVRKAAILNRIRLNVRQAAASRGHEWVWQMTELGAMGHSIQLVTDSTGAMFPGRSGEQVPGPIVPRIWRPHTTVTAAPPEPFLLTSSVARAGPESHQVPDVPKPPTAQPSNQQMQQTEPPPTSIMTPMAGADDDDVAFPSPDLDYRYADLSDDDMDDVYADFGVLFGGRAESPEKSRGDGFFYEEYLDEVDGIVWAS